jgi:pyruvate-formate lyase-activating enzyme
VFRAYYRPIGYSLEDVVECGRVVGDAGGQVCLNLLTFPGITDAPDELERTIDACRAMGVMQVQWRSLNVDHDWLVRVLPDMQPGVGMRVALQQVRETLPTVQHGNFTRPFPPTTTPTAR